MPQAVPIIFATAGQAAGAAMGSYLAGFAVTTGLTMLSNSLMRQPGKQRMPVNVTVRSTVADRKIVFGEVRAGGAILFAKCSGGANKYLWYVVGYAGHRADDCASIWLQS